MTKLLRKAGRLQLIQNSAPSTIVLHKCDIQISKKTARNGHKTDFCQLQILDISLYFSLQLHVADSSDGNLLNDATSSQIDCNKTKIV